MSEKRSKRECGKDNTLGAPGPLPEICLATHRDVFLATEYAPGSEEASAEVVKEQLKHLFSKVTPTLSVIEDKSVLQKIYRCCESVRRFRSNKLSAYQKAKFLENLDRIFNISKCQHKFRSCLESLCTTVIAPALLWIKCPRKKELSCKIKSSAAHRVISDVKSQQKASKM